MLAESQEPSRDEKPRRSDPPGFGKERFRVDDLLSQRSADVDQIVGDHAEPDPTLHAGLLFVK